DHARIVGGDAVVNAAFEQHFHKLDVVGVDLGFLLKSNFGRLLIGTFAEANANAFGKKRLHVTLAAVQVRLNDGADRARVPGVAVQVAHKVQGTLGVGRALHVHANEVGWTAAGGPRHQAGDQLPGQPLVDVHTHVGELQAYVGLQIALFDFLEQAMVDASALARFFAVSDVLTQIIDA